MSSILYRECFSVTYGYYREAIPLRLAALAVCVLCKARLPGQKVSEKTGLVRCAGHAPLIVSADDWQLSQTSRCFAERAVYVNQKDNPNVCYC